MQNQNQLIVQGKPLTLPDFGQAVNGKYSLVGARRYVAAAAGLAEAAIKGLSMKEVKDLAIKAGLTEERVTELKGEYNAHEKEHRKFSRIATALFAADPAFRQVWRPNFNKKGGFVGATTTFRREKSLSVSATVRMEQQAERIKQLEAIVAKLGGLAALPAIA